MKLVVIGVHLRRDDVEPVAEAIAVGRLFLSALSIAADQPLGDRELLLRVAKIRAALLERATFIAVRYGFTVASAQDAESKCAAHLERWERLLEKNRDNVEMTLKVVVSSTRPRPNRKDFATGAEYLKALHEATHAVDVNPDFKNAVAAHIVPLCVDHRLIHRDQQSVEFAALVARTRVNEVRAAAESLRSAAPEVPFLLSGPWPLEVFADADHE